MTSYQPQILHQECFYGYNDSRKVSLQSVDVNLDFWHLGIWASELPFGPGERLKRPGLIGLNMSCSGRQGGELYFLFGKFKACVKTYLDFKL